MVKIFAKGEKNVSLNLLLGKKGNVKMSRKKCSNYSPFNNK